MTKKVADQLPKKEASANRNCKTFDENGNENENEKIISNGDYDTELDKEFAYNLFDENEEPDKGQETYAMKLRKTFKY